MSTVSIARKHIAFGNRIHTDGIEPQTGSRTGQQLGEFHVEHRPAPSMSYKFLQGVFGLLYPQTRHRKPRTVMQYRANYGQYAYRYY